MKRRLLIARGLINMPRILVLDEPTIGLDPQAKYLVWRKLTELAETVKGVTKEMETLRVDAQHRIPARMLCESLAERFRKLSRKLVE